MKAFTDISQSRKLAEILPLESADMMYHSVENEYGTGTFVATSKFLTNGLRNDDFYIDDIPCWSLAALLSVLPFHIIAHNQRYAFGMFKGLNKDGETYSLTYSVYNTEIFLHRTDYYNNPVDCCVEMIIMLHELNLL